MTSQPRDKTRDSTKHDTAKFGLDLHKLSLIDDISFYFPTNNYTSKLLFILLLFIHILFLLHILFMEDSTSTSVSTRELRNSTQRDRDRARLANESDTDRELRNSTQRDKDRARLANESDTDRELRNSTRRDRDRARLVNESDTDRELRNSTRRDRDRARLANESDTDREQHLSTSSRRDRARIRRQNLNRNTYNHLTRKITLHRMVLSHLLILYI